MIQFRQASIFRLIFVLVVLLQQISVNDVSRVVSFLSIFFSFYKPLELLEFELRAFFALSFHLSNLIYRETFLCTMSRERATATPRRARETLSWLGPADDNGLCGIPQCRLLSPITLTTPHVLRTPLVWLLLDRRQAQLL